MRDAVGSLDLLIQLSRSVAAGLIAISAVLAALAWGVRSRRINPFGAVGRFVRGAVEPLLTPLDRRLVRYGVTGPSVPWWGVLIVLMVAATVIFALGFVRDLVVSTYLATNAGPRGLLSLAVRATFATLQLALIVRVVTSWIGGAYSGVGRLAARLTEWFLAPLRQALPATSGIDLSPLVAWLLLMVVQAAIFRIL